MPKSTKSELISKYLSIAIYKTFEKEKNYVRCKYCADIVNIRDGHIKQCLDEHLKSKTHLKKSNGQQQKSIESSINKLKESNSNLNEFNLELTRSFIESGIPLEKVGHPSIKSFLEKYSKKTVYSRQVLQKNYMDKLYEDSIDQIKNDIGSSNVYFIVDETTDRMGRNVVNILVGALNGEKSKSWLLMQEFQKVTNHSTVGQAFQRSCSKLWPDDVKFERVVLVVTDQAPYMIKCFSAMKLIFTNLHHVSCLVHCLHRVCEKVREDHDLISQFIGKVKRALSYSSSLRSKFKSELGSLPPQTIITRWGTFLDATEYYLKNFDAVKILIMSISSQSKGITKLKCLLENKDLQEEFLSIKDFIFIKEIIEKFQTRHLKVRQQLYLLEEAKSKLYGSAAEKLRKSLLKNPDLLKFTSDQNSFEHKNLTCYAPLVSVEVERSFSLYKYILSDRRTSLLTINIEKLNIIQFNAVHDE